MAQHDYAIADQNGLSFLSDLNNALSAIVSNNSGATEPSDTFPYMFWVDTNAGILKQRNAADDGWINKLSLTGTALEVGQKASQAQMQAGTNDTTYATPLKTLQSIEESVPELSGLWLSYGGTADAIALSSTTNRTIASYVDGAQYRFRATTTNTGAATIAIDGLAAIDCVTVTGVALPAGYIRTTADTVFRYDAGNNQMIVDRFIEKGSSANGKYTKFSDGSASITKVETPSSNLNSGTSTTFPLTFSSPPRVFVTPDKIASGSNGGSNVAETENITTTGCSVKVLVHAASVINDATNVPIQIVALGDWY